tara:strand:+ start:5006 stop:5560 length:555 start_codon:yes stop_codon:yes gene_type:complete
MNKKYQIIYADPPWDYKGQTQHGGKGTPDTGGASAHYPTLTVAEMKKWDLSSYIDPNGCLLYMWTSSPHLDQSIELMKAWGFKWATVGFVWDKTKVNPGYYTMSQCELCLIGKYHRIPKPRGARNIRQLVQVPRGKHSEKPEEVRKRIEEMFPTQDKLEMFARKKADGWDSWGNEIDGVQLTLE